MFNDNGETVGKNIFWTVRRASDFLCSQLLNVKSATANLFMLFKRLFFRARNFSKNFVDKNSRLTSFHVHCRFRIFVLYYISGNDGETFRNKKRHFSISVGKNLKILNVQVRWPGYLQRPNLF